MGNLNISSNMAQALATPKAKELVTAILADNKVDKTDSAKLKELKTLLEASAKVDDQKIDADEETLIKSLADDGSFLGIFSTGTNAEVLLSNLSSIKSFQDSNTDPSALNFDGKAITVDGWLGDEVRVVRLRDRVEPPADTDHTATQQNGAVNTGGSAVDLPVEEEPDTTIPPKQEYTPSTKPEAQLPPPITTDEGLSAKLGPQVTAHNEAVQQLQTDVSQLRDALNDPQKITNDQLRANIDTFVRKDPGNATMQLMRLNPQLLEDMQKQGLLSAGDVENIRTYLESNQTDRLNSTSFTGNVGLSDKLTAYLSKKPLTDSQLNGYRSELVAKADAYLTKPDQANFDNLKNTFSKNLYVFEKGVSPELETTYRSMATNLSNVEQRQQILSSQKDVLTGTKQVIAGQYAPITDAQELAKRLGTAAPSLDGANSDATITAFADETQNVVDYLKLMKNQYEGQSQDVSALESKLKELKSTNDPQRKLALVNEIKTGLDEVYVKTGIQNGSGAINLDETKQRLEQIATSSTNPQEQATAAFLAKYPEILQMGPKISDYSTVLQHLNTKTPLTSQETNLKAALETGDVKAVNNLFLQDLMGGASFWGFPIPPADGLNMTVPGGWGKSALLAQSLGNINPPERRTEIMQALQAPETHGLASGFAGLSEGIQSSTAIQEISAQFTLADKAKTSIESASWSDYSTGSALQTELTTQIQDKLALEHELTTARQEIDALLKDDNVAAPVKEKLKLQLKALDDTLAQIKAGTFTGENIPANSPLNSVLTALNKQNLQKELSPRQQLQLQATLEAFDDLKKDPKGLAQLEAFVKAKIEAEKNLPEDKKRWSNFSSTIFEKDGDNNYKFPDQMQAILNDPNLSPEAYNLMLTESNRVLHLTDMAKSNNLTSIDSFLKIGQQQDAAGKGHGEFYSGFKAIQNLDQFLNYQKANPGTEPSYLLNEIANNLPKTDPTTLKTTEERRQYRTDASNAFGKGIEDLKSKVLTDLSGSEAYTGLTQLFGADDSQKKALALLNEDIAKINPDAGTVSSVEDFFKKLSPSDIQKLTAQNDKRLVDLQKLIPEKEEALNKITDPKKKAEAAAEIKALQDEYTLRTSSLSKVLNSENTDKIAEMSNAANVLRSELTSVKETAQAEVNRLIGELKGKVSDEDLAQIESLKNDPVKLREYLSKMDVSKLGSLTQTHIDMLDFSALTLQQVAYVQNKIDRAEPISEQDRDTVTALRASNDVLKGLSRQFVAQGGGSKAATNFRDGVKSLRDVFLKNVPGARLSATGTDGTGSTGGGGGSDAIGKLGGLGTITAHVADVANNLAQDGSITQADAEIVTHNATQLNSALLSWNSTLVQAKDAGLDDATIYQVLGKPPAREEEVPPHVTIEDIGESLSGLATTVENTSDQDLGAVVNAIYESTSNNAAAWDQLENAFDTYLQTMSPILQSMGQPGIDLSAIEDQPVSMEQNAQLNARTQALIDEADSDEANMTLAPMPPVSGGEHFDAWLRDVMKTVGEWSEIERQKFVAELAQKMMNEVLRAFYKDRQDKGSEHHEAAIAASKQHATQLQQVYSAGRELSSAENSQAVASISGGEGTRSSDRSEAFNRSSNMSPEQQRELVQDLIKYARQGVLFDPDAGVFKKFDPPPVITPMQEKALMAQYDLMIKAASTPTVEDDLRAIGGMRTMATGISMN